MKIFTIIPARGGSKRLKDKNIYPLKGKPLINYTIEAALNSNLINKKHLYVSTESEKISEVALKNKKIKRIRRPDYLATDSVWTQPVIDDAIEIIELMGNRVDHEDIIVILQANSPQITGELIDICIEKLIQEKLWQVHTVDENLINNGAIQVMLKKVCKHKGKANYNGVVITNLIDVHTIEDLNKVEKKL